MSGTATISLRTTLGGTNFISSIAKEDEVETVFTEEVAAGKAGTVTTRTDANTGILTVASGHGITDADTVSVFWDGGYRYGMTVSATTSTTISIDGGTGDDLPVLTTAIVVGKEAEHAIAITGDSLSVFVIDCDNRVSVHFRDGSDTSLLAYDILTNEGRLWVKNTGNTNPIAGDVVANVVLANGGITNKNINIGFLASSD